MKADVKGTTLPVLEVLLDPGEEVVSTHGQLSWMSPNLQMSQTTSTGPKSGLMAGLKRMAGGGALPDPLLRRVRPGDGGLCRQASRADLPG